MRLVDEIEAAPFDSLGDIAEREGIGSQRINIDGHDGWRVTKAGRSASAMGLKMALMTLLEDEREAHRRDLDCPDS